MDATAAPRRPAHVLQNVQGLRAIAALLVVLVHASLPHVGVEEVMAPGTTPWLTAFGYIGLSGVDLFFVISGFIMLVTNWNAFAKPFAGLRFFARRAIRIYPPYWLALVPIVPAYLFARDRLMVSHAGVKTGLIESILLLPQPNRFVLTVAWTLVWEIVFYIVFSQLLRLQRKHIGIALAAWFAIELIATTTLGSVPNFYIHFLSVPLPIEFIFGAFVGLAYKHGRLPAPLVTFVAGLLGIAAAWTFVSIARVELDPEHLERVFVFGVPAALLLAGAVGLEERRGLRVPRAVASVGDASYAIYLWHLSILVALRQIIERLAPGGAVAHAVVIALTLAIVVGVGLAIYHFFEMPVTRTLNKALDGLLPVRITLPAARLTATEALTHEA